MTWSHTDTATLAFILGMSPSAQRHRPFTNFWLAALGVAQQYKLVYGEPPYKLSSMLRQIGAAIATGSTLVFARHPDVVRRLAAKHNCTVPQFWAAHVIYHVCPVRAVWHHRTQSLGPRLFGLALHLLWFNTTDLQLAYTRADAKAIMQGMAMAVATHAVV